MKNTLFLIPFAAMGFAIVAAPKAAVAHVPVRLAEAQANNYMDDPSENYSDDDVPVIGLPADDSGTDSNSATVTDVPSQYTAQHPESLENDADGDEDVDGNDSLDRDDGSYGDDDDPADDSDE